MEDNFNRDDFEQMLKDTTEDFRMYPSRKVWHSIYNDLHPDRKWPSLAVCLLLLTAILYLGVSNNNNISKESRNLLASSLTSETSSANFKTNNIATFKDEQQANIHAATLPNNRSNILRPSVDVSGIDYNLSTEIVNANQANQNFKNVSVEVANTVAKNSMSEINEEGHIDNVLLTDNKKQQTNEEGIVSNKTNISNINTQGINTFPAESKAIKTIEIENIDDSKTLEKENTDKIKETSFIKTSNINTEEKSWMEDHAFHNLHNRNKWKTNLSVEYYITPSVGYRELYKNNDFEPASGILQRTTDNNNVLSQQAAFNFEGGVAWLLKLNKRLRLKTGLQLNYTNYITYAHQLQHPTQTTVLMNNIQNGNLMPVDYNSIYGNVLGSNETKLNNYTVQISLPIGLDYKLAGNGKINWYMGADIQPTYVIDGNAYLISANYKNYVSDPSILRNWNVNTSIESFVSFKTPGNILLNVGPQFRYQLLSTYSKQYSYTEKLYNIGLKVGVIKKL